MIKYDKKELCLIWLDSFLGLEYKHKYELYKRASESGQPISELLQSSKDYLLSEIGAEAFGTLASSCTAGYLQFVTDGLSRRGVAAVTVESADYPEGLLNTPCPPLVLYAKGDTKLLKSKSFGIVGSRKSLPLSVKIAENYTEELCGAGFTVVTGIAEGIDSAVLKSALNCGGKAISVIAGGFDHVYPASNRDLFERVGKNGLAISEHPPEVSPKPFHFPVRNRIISALAKGVLIVRGALKSGTLYTAEYAEEYGKDLFAVPYSPGIESGAGCNDLIKRGAILTDNPNDILDFYGIKKQNAKKIVLTDSEREIINALKNGELHIEKLSGVLGKRVFEITPTLSILEIKGLVVKTGNVYGLIRNYSEE